MSKPSSSKSGRAPAAEAGGMDRIVRPLNLVQQVTQMLREAIKNGQFIGDRLPTEVELADQLGVSRETVRRATDTLAKEGLLKKFRRKGTFTHHPELNLQFQPAPSTLLGYLQADYPASTGQEEAVTRAISGLMLQGAIEEAGRSGFDLVVRRAPQAQMSKAFQKLSQSARLRGMLFASYGEEKLLRQVAGLGLPTVLLDHDLPLPRISSVRDDSFEGARQAIHHLADLGHRRIALALWHRTDLNPWRLMGYRQGLRDAKLPRRRAWELYTELTAAGAEQVVDQLLKLTPRPTTLVCFNNSLARWVMEVLPKHGVRVPEDLSIMGSGGEDVPGLTCYQADWYALGQRAMQLLLREFTTEAPPPPEHLLFPHTLRRGVTTAAPAE